MKSFIRSEKFKFLLQLRLASFPGPRAAFGPGIPGTKYVYHFTLRLHVKLGSHAQLINQTFGIPEPEVVHSFRLGTRSRLLPHKAPRARRNLPVQFLSITEVGAPEEKKPE